MKKTIHALAGLLVLAPVHTDPQFTMMIVNVVRPMAKSTSLVLVNQVQGQGRLVSKRL